MAWNDNNDNNDNNRGNKSEGPPDLDELLKKIKVKIEKFFNGSKVENFSNAKQSFKTLPLKEIVLFLLGIYVLTGIYIVAPKENAVIKRFGQYVRTEKSGLHWFARFIEKKHIVDMTSVRSITHGGEMLTMDENIIDAKIAVQYSVRESEGHKYLFNMSDPDESLEQVSESVLRAVVGQSSLDEILTTGRADITYKIRKQVQAVLDSYQSGLLISDLAMQQTKPPTDVQSAFDDAIKAQQDEERYVNKAEAYARQRVPIAEGEATRILEEARAYKEQVILGARGETARFLQILPEYRLNPKVMRDRMYLDAMQQVYSNTSKVIVNLSGANNMIYLPLDKLIKDSKKTSATKVNEE